MSRTFKTSPPNPYRKEAKFARKHTGRAFRSQSRQALRNLKAGNRDVESIVFPVVVHTGGWITW